MRLALAAVENGAADAAIVYRTDIAAASAASLALAIPVADGPRIVYPAAVIRSGRNRDARNATLCVAAGRRGGEASSEAAGFIRSREAVAAEVLEIALFTTVAALAATVVMLPPGIALAWVLARHRFRGKAVVETLASLPLVMPPVATGLLLLWLLGRRGPVGRLLEPFGIEIVFTPAAVVLAMAIMGLPLLVRTARAGFEQVTKRYEQMAETLGARPWRVFTTVTLPLASRNILAGALLGFTRALGEFGATIVVAGSIPGRTRTLAVGIYTYTETGQDARAAALLVVSVALAFGAALIANRLARVD